ncbi:MAG TPA: cell wall-binding repeat-containing protein, partial [Acidothermaceae bacterium]
STATYLGAHPGRAYAIGGPAAAADPAASATVGVDRYATAAAVATKFFSAPTIVGFATGSNFPDALAGGSLLAKEGAPLLLATAAGLSTPTATYLTSVRSSVVTAQLFGGDTVISGTASTAITNALN